MAFGVGISAIRRDKEAADDSFGLIALCSVGPILAVMILSIIFRPESISNSETWLPNVAETVELRNLFVNSFPTYLKEIGLALLPIMAFFGIFQLVSLKLDKRVLIRIGVGLLYTYTGLVLFMTGVNVGFLPVGTFLGQTIALLPYRWIVIPIGMLIGFFIVNAEPAIYVLTRQVEGLTNGLVKGNTLKWSLAISVSVSIGLAMLRVLTGIPVSWFIVPGYFLAIVLSFFTPKIFTAIAFDSGGVASGPMTATFLLPFAMGACISVGGNITTDAFGVVAMVAMTPLLTIQVLGILFSIKEKRLAKGIGKDYVAAADTDLYAVIEL
jgi:intracellular septation protein A